MRKLFSMAVVACMILASCTKEDLSPNNTNGTTLLGVSTASVSAVATRNSSNLLTNGSQIGVSLIADAANGYSDLKNVEYDYSTTSPAGWAPASTNTKNIYLNNLPATVCAYYPLGAAGINSSTDQTSVTLTSQKYDAAQDLCYAVKQKAPTNSAPSVSFAMNRAYAEITFSITKDATYTGIGLIDKITISNTTARSTNTLDITTGTYGSSIPASGSVFYNPGITAITPGTPATSTVLMVPTVLSGTITFSFVVDGKTMSTTLDASANNLSALVFGNNYKANVTLKGTQLVVSSVTTQDWTDQAVTNGMVIN